MWTSYGHIVLARRQWKRCSSGCVAVLQSCCVVGCGLWPCGHWSQYGTSTGSHRSPLLHGAPTADVVVQCKLLRTHKYVLRVYFCMLLPNTHVYILFFTSAIEGLLVKQIYRSTDASTPSCNCTGIPYQAAFSRCALMSALGEPEQLKIRPRNCPILRLCGCTYGHPWSHEFLNIPIQRLRGRHTIHTETENTSTSRRGIILIWNRLNLPPYLQLRRSP